MLSHRHIWSAIDGLAARFDLTPSGLAKLAGLDPTTFNKSKRLTADGRQRWPSTESLSKILEATGSSLDEFVELVANARGEASSNGRRIPLIGFAQAGSGGYFDDAGFPTGSGWDEINFPGMSDDGSAFALEISGNSMLPLYRDGDVIVVSPAASIRRGDRVVLRTSDGEVFAKLLLRKTAQTVELASLNPEHPNLTFRLSDIDWLARILWASQ